MRYINVKLANKIKSLLRDNEFRSPFFNTNDEAWNFLIFELFKLLEKEDPERIARELAAKGLRDRARESENE